MITICPFGADGITFDGIDISEALTRLEAEGADVVGLNCGRGPRTMIPLIKKCKEKVKVRQTDLCYQYTLTFALRYLLFIMRISDR